MLLSGKQVHSLRARIDISLRHKNALSACLLKPVMEKVTHVKQATDQETGTESHLTSRAIWVTLV